jgi:hypothetical protein
MGGIRDKSRDTQLTVQERCRPQKSHSVCLLALAVCLSSVKLGKGAGQAASAADDSGSQAVVQLLAIGPGGQEQNRECSATGFLINEKGYILTNAHVVQDAHRCLAASPKSKIMAKVSGEDPHAARAVSCDLVGLDAVHDLAVLKMERPLATIGGTAPYDYALLNPADFADGTPVLVTGHPVFAWQPLTQTGKVIRRMLVQPSQGNGPTAGWEPTEAFVIDIKLEEGHSGSPVYLPHGAGVIGIIVGQEASDPTHSVAVSARHAIELLDRYNVKWYAKR